MGHWNWRPCAVWVFICVLIVACTETNAPLPDATPTDLPPVTLIIRIPREAPPTPFGLPVEATLSYRTPSPATSAAPPPLMTARARHPTPSPPPLTVSAPVCYEAANDGVLCLGWVRNPHDHTLENVVLHVEILRDNAQALDSALVTLPQQIIAPGESAPYHALFSGAGNATHLRGVDVGVVGARFGTTAESALRFEKRESVLVDGVYQVVGEIINDGDETIESARVVVTVFDTEDRILGFRVLEVTQIGAGESKAVTIRVMPQATVDDMRHVLHIESAR